jgi:hypothetical protein
MIENKHQKYVSRLIANIPRYGILTASSPVNKGGLSMSIASHLAELERRHAALDGEIKKITALPGADSLRVAEMKRRKLILKDEINRLRTDETVH